MSQNEVIFMFYSKSNDKPLPGHGSGEKINKNQQDKFIELSKIKSWRKKLSNFWIEPFYLDNKKWASVEHYYQGSKFKNNNPEFYNLFSMDSNSDISKDPIIAKGAGGKTGKSKGKLYRPKNIIIDDDFFSKRSEKEMYNAQMAKFTQNEELKHLLIATKNAKLMHYQRGSQPIEFTGLMKIRNCLLKE